MDYEEKRTDVAIASDLLLDAVDDTFDVALLVTGDGDLVPAVERVRRRRHGLTLVNLRPPNRDSSHLRKLCDAALVIAESRIRQNQLPHKVVTKDGSKAYIRPREWM